MLIYTPWNAFDVWLHHSIYIYIYIQIYIYIYTYVIHIRTHIIHCGTVRPTKSAALKMRKHMIGTNRQSIKNSITIGRRQLEKRILTTPWVFLWFITMAIDTLYVCEDGGEQG